MKATACTLVSWSLTAATLVLAGCATTQSRQPATPVVMGIAPAPPPTPLVEPAPVIAQLPSALEEVVRLTQSGMTDAVVMAYIENHPDPFYPTAEQLVFLRDAGVREDLIERIIKHRASLTRATAPVAAVQVQSYQPTATQVAVGGTTPIAPPVVTTEVVAAVPLENRFYSALSPYGNWINVSGYGVCWQPAVAQSVTSWQPYSTAGRWAHTDYGWYWLSDYKWGWVPFHYGRWHRHASHGWVWHPDNVWGPAWVSWRYGSDYCGWAPLPPEAIYEPRYGFRYHGSRVSFGFEFGLSHSAYTFISLKHFHHRYPHQYYLSGTHRANVYRNTTVVNNFVQDNSQTTIINNNIPVAAVARASRTVITKIPVRNADPIAGRSLVMPDRTFRNGNVVAVMRTSDPSTANKGNAGRSVPVAASSSRSIIAKPGQSPSISNRVNVPGRTISSGKSDNRQSSGTKATTSLPLTVPVYRPRRVTVTLPAPVSRPFQSSSSQPTTTSTPFRSNITKPSSVWSPRPASRPTPVSTPTPQSFQIQTPAPTPSRVAPIKPSYTTPTPARSVPARTVVSPPTAARVIVSKPPPAPAPPTVFKPVVRTQVPAIRPIPRAVTTPPRAAPVSRAPVRAAPQPTPSSKPASSSSEDKKTPSARPARK